MSRPEVDINIRSNDGVCPFTVSVIKDHIDISRLLLTREDLRLGGDAEVFEERGIDPLHIAASKGRGA